MADLPKNKQQREHDKFDLNNEGEVIVRTDSSGSNSNLDLQLAIETQTKHIKALLGIIEAQQESNGIQGNIQDGSGKGFSAKVTPDQAILTTSTALPHDTDKDKVRIFRQYITDDGTAQGSSDMRVDGSVNHQDFYIEAPQDADRYIDTISIAIADAGAALNQFGSIGALANGVEIFYQDTESGDVIIADNLVSNFEFLRMCAGGVHGIGTGNSSYRANNVEGNSEGFLMYLDFSEVFGVPWGVKLRRGTKLRLIIRIHDDIQGVDKFDMIAYGFDRKL